MALEVGEVFEGKVTGITKFGAFVAMPDGKNGLVHISEIANTYVSDINEFVKEGQVVKVRVIGIGDGGKVNLSMKQAEAPTQARPARPRFNRDGRDGGRDHREGGREGGYYRDNREGGRGSYNRDGRDNRDSREGREGGRSYNREGGYNRENRDNREGGSSYQGGYRRPSGNRDDRRGEVRSSSGNASFEDKLKQFMQESDSRIAGNKMYADHKSSRRRK